MKRVMGRRFTPLEMTNSNGVNAEKTDKNFYREDAKYAKESKNIIQSIWTQIYPVRNGKF
jgi:hypothetical protein